MYNANDLVLRWSIGSQDTTIIEESSLNKYKELIWLAKLSVVSFQKWFLGAEFVIFYNGYEFDEFKNLFESCGPSLICDVIYVDQYQGLLNGYIKHGYDFFPTGVWWKWVPFRYNISCNEISIDTDIICINEPLSWYYWLESFDCDILVASERFDRILINTCGDFYTHPVLRNKKPLNCGIVGHRADRDYSNRFYDIACQIDLGKTHNSLFITEQGAINLWAYSLEQEGINHHILDFEKNSWMRDFIYYMEKSVKVETIHATTWHKSIVYAMKDIFERKISDNTYVDDAFIRDVIERSKKLNVFQNYLIRKQIGTSDQVGSDYLLKDV